MRLSQEKGRAIDYVFENYKPDILLPPINDKIGKYKTSIKSSKAKKKAKTKRRTSKQSRKRNK